MATDALATDPSFPGWKLLRVIENNGSDGSFDADTNWCDTAVDIPVDVATSVQRYRSDSGAVAVASAEVMISAFDEDGARVARGSGTVTITPMQWIRRPPNDLEDTPAGAVGITVDGEAAEDSPLDRPISMRMYGLTERFTVHLSEFTAIPGTANHLRVYWRDLG